ncbi:MAG: tetratricopeptide repeat protein [Akkermansiaceae bacterium]|nr:tetratricopeptide repeat protein [Akkermansiaceae bacterium]
MAIACSLGATPLHAQADRDAAYVRGNVLFEQGDYAGAEKLYRGLAEAGHRSEELYFNLGNTLFRLQRPGEAALWYHRALALDPRFGEARQNLRVVENLTGNLVFDPGDLVRWLRRLTPADLAGLVSLFAWIALLCAASVLALPRLKPWRPLLWIVTLLSVTAVGFFLWCLRRYDRDVSIDRMAIVTAPETKAITSPYPDAKEVIALPPGSEVRIVLDRGPWTFVAIPDELRGWVRTETIGRVVPEPAAGPDQG